MYYSKTKFSEDFFNLLEKMKEMHQKYEDEAFIEIHNLENEIDILECDIYNLRSEASELYNENEYLERRIGDLNNFSIRTLYDKMKFDFIFKNWENIELEDLEKIIKK